MSNELKIFNSPEFGEVRTAGDSENPLFCLKDVLRALGLKDYRTERLGDEVISNHPVLDTIGRTQQMIFVNEDGLYDIILDSRKPEAKAFRKWITSVVIPSIRKHGAYMTAATIEDILNDPDNGIRLLTALKDEREARKAAEITVTEQQLKINYQLETIEKQAPKVAFADAVIGSSSSISVGDFAKILTQNGVKIGRTRLYKWFREHEYIMKDSRKPYQRYVEQGLFDVKEVSFSRGDVLNTETVTRITGKGQQYFIEKFLGTKGGVQK